MTGTGDRAAEILLHGILDRAFPAAAVEVGRGNGPLWQRALGTLTYDPDSLHATIDTVFDLASLTKVIATTTLAMRAIDDGLLTLDDSVASRFPEWRGTDRETVTVRDLLSHASGLPAYLPFFRNYTGRVEFEPAICHTPLEYSAADPFGVQRSRIHAAWVPPAGCAARCILERPAPRSIQHARGTVPRASPPSSPSTRWRSIRRERGVRAPRRPNTTRGEAGRWSAKCTTRTRGRLAARRTCRTLRLGAGSRRLRAVRVAGPSPANACWRTVDLPRVHPAQRLPGSSRALGWDTMLPTSSCGTRMSATRDRSHRFHRDIAVDRLGA